mmetsp:Transcript_14996/g.28982  ORF Transcript_14996/g.28982 Transcript_14996/m.28982 type:complete len:161 (-) Transcript_14996:39-521(-)
MHAIVIVAALVTVTYGVTVKEPPAYEAWTPLPTGMSISVLKDGDKKTIPHSGEMVELQYTGRLVATGEVFDSSRTNGEPFKFRMGAKKVIPCYEFALKEMSLGERATFRCPAPLAYGEAGVPGRIPSNADLEFDVEILAVYQKPLSLFERLKAKELAKLE